MGEPHSAGPGESAALQSGLHQIAEFLRRPGQLGPEAQQALAELVEELSRRLDAGTVASAEVKHLTESTAQLIQVLHRADAPEAHASARTRLEQAIANAEAQAPFLAGMAQRVLDALANLGI